MTCTVILGIYLVYIHYILPVCEWVDGGGIWIQTVELCQYCLSFIVWWLLLARGLFPFINALFTLLVLLFHFCPLACISACSGPRSWLFFCSDILIITFSMNHAFWYWSSYLMCQTAFLSSYRYKIEKVNLGQILDAVGAWQIQKIPILFPVCHSLRF